MPLGIPLRTTETLIKLIRQSRASYCRSIGVKACWTNFISTPIGSVQHLMDDL
jgi:hypothetical protein